MIILVRLDPLCRNQLVAFGHELLALCAWDCYSGIELLPLGPFVSTRDSELPLNLLIHLTVDDRLGVLVLLVSSFCHEH